MSNNSYGRNQVIGEACYLEHIGHDFIKSALLLYEKNRDEGGSGDYFSTINFLASQSLELLPKSLIAVCICLNKNNNSLEEIRGAISKELGCLGHNLDNIFNGVPELKKTLNIIDIKRINNKTNTDIFIDEFHFVIKNNSDDKKTIRIKNLEAARYGLFARNKDIGGNSSRDMENIVDFLKRLSKKTAEIRASIINEFDNIDIYKNLVEIAGKKADGSSLSEWELNLFNKRNPAYRK